MLEILKTSRKNAKREIKKIKKKGARLVTISELKDDLVYTFSLREKIINLKVKLNKKRPEIISITDVFPNAELYEREIMEKTRVIIRGHPNPKKLFTE